MSRHPNRRVFVSYRRETGAQSARLVYDALEKRGYSPFMDVEDLKSGLFNTALYQQIDDSTHMVVVLTANSLDRCTSEDDWLRLEVAYAIQKGKNIVPVMIRGFKWPDVLPDDLRPLPKYQGISPSHELWKESMDRLCILLPVPSRLPVRRAVRAVAWCTILIALGFVAWRGMPQWSLDSLRKVKSNNATQRQSNQSPAQLQPSTVQVVPPLGPIGPETPLHVAAANGRKELVPTLLSTGIDVNARDQDGRTPLHRAAEGGFDEITEMLMAAGADVNARDVAGKTPLHKANSINLIKSLVAKGARSDIQDTSGYTPLDLAVEKQGSGIARALLDAGGRASPGSSRAFNLLCVAIRDKDKHTFEQLIGQSLVNKESLETLLYLAADNGSAGIVEVLLDRGVSVNSRTNKNCYGTSGRGQSGSSYDFLMPGGATPLHFAAGQGHDHVVLLLVSRGAEVGAPTDGSERWTALHLAAMNGHASTVALLINAGAPIEAVDGRDLTPLALAANCNKSEIVKLLIAKNASVCLDPQTASGRAMLGSAIRQDTTSCLEQLIAQGAAVKGKNEGIGELLCTAASLDKKAAIELLVTKGANPASARPGGYTALHAAAAMGRTDVMEFLISKGLDVNAVTRDGIAPIHEAVGWNAQQSVVELLIAKGANIRASDKLGKTPLHLAAGNGHLGIVRLLLSKDAPVESKAIDGATPLHAAAVGGFPDIAKILVSQSAHVDVATDSKTTPLHEAASHGFPSVTEFLIAAGANINACNKDKDKPLDLALRCYDSSNSSRRSGQDVIEPREVIRVLIEKGAQFDVQTALVEPVGKGWKDIAQLLIEKGANVNGRTHLDVTPLGSALCNASKGKDCVKFLLSKGANVNQTSQGWYPVHVAAASGDLDSLRLLVSKGAKLGVKTKTARPYSNARAGETPLDIAVRMGHKAVAEWLLSQSGKGSESRLGQSAAKTPERRITDTPH